MSSLSNASITWPKSSIDRSPSPCAALSRTGDPTICARAATGILIAKGASSNGCRPPEEYGHPTPTGVFTSPPNTSIPICAGVSITEPSVPNNCTPLDCLLTCHPLHPTLPSLNSSIASNNLCRCPRLRNPKSSLNVPLSSRRKTRPSTSLEARAWVNAGSAAEVGKVSRTQC
ncbi:hypothetical protein SAICODRAFT_28390 [Saitoella complicata NRRL Y-17804]|uniref:uncharacterized protein n=1 Tax=Saitoella complicata (strain BCRC 22490 / CBS 7301 / JCM 7358 / NBRC 10748 / NRRL Y-17804) TaxID=698492 RepID=UPI00086726EC|nr:uncharacterized protein SAICODRAFT_28390 [Saitoella complicata NRRL Y-17804]ODQ56124.1 hypothetical protein SAICODRAFT_28390 [Saitoella complicata NRRL Y-17804]